MHLNLLSVRLTSYTYGKPYYKPQKGYSNINGCSMHRIYNWIAPELISRLSIQNLELPEWKCNRHIGLLPAQIESRSRWKRRLQISIQRPNPSFIRSKYQLAFKCHKTFYCKSHPRACSERYEMCQESISLARSFAT